MGGLSASAVSLSPDKKWIVYVAFPKTELWRARPDGSERLKLADDIASMPAWSPDSKQIAFTDWAQIYKVSVDGGSVEQLTSSDHQEIAPSWSPDGKSIYFSDYPYPGEEYNQGPQNSRSCDEENHAHARLQDVSRRVLVA